MVQEIKQALFDNQIKGAFRKGLFMTTFWFVVILIGKVLILAVIGYVLILAFGKWVVNKFTKTTVTTGTTIPPVITGTTTTTSVATVTKEQWKMPRLLIAVILLVMLVIITPGVMALLAFASVIFAPRPTQTVAIVTATPVQQNANPDGLSISKSPPIPGNAVVYQAMAEESVIRKASVGKHFWIELSDYTDVLEIRGVNVLTDGTRIQVGKPWRLGGAQGIGVSFPPADYYYVKTIIKEEEKYLKKEVKYLWFER